MTKISILYLNDKGSQCDTRYCTAMHMLLTVGLLSAQPGFKGVCVEHGTGGAEPGTGTAYVARCHFLFESAEDFRAAFVPHVATLQGDMADGTDVRPIIQFNEVVCFQEQGTMHDLAD